jgi:ACS family hexuronate transporter-like MFS transporter
MSAARKWWICGLLLMASAINYMDRVTLANAAVRISAQFELSKKQYGDLEFGFGWAFALGSLLCGILVDRVSVRYVYPVILLLWSAMGYLTGLANGYTELLICRTLLGLFEAGHWPCAIKTTQRLLEPKDRSMGNSVLQSGTSIGAIITPLLMRILLTPELNSWRGAFQIIAAIGVVWVVLWFLSVRAGDFAPTLTSKESAAPGATEGGGSVWEIILSKRMLALFVMVACINTCFQTLRAWLPRFMQEGRGYTESDTLYFTSLFFVATDIGCLGAGALTLWLHRRGMTVHRSRTSVFIGCAALAGLTILLFFLPRGWMLSAVLLVVGAGALGVFPIYHAFSQELSREHQGKVTGIASIGAWVFSAPGQRFFGQLIDRTGSFDLGLAVAGCLPILGFVIFWLLWRSRAETGSAKEA